MNTRIYALLNQDAKSWWYFRKLRAQGLQKEARSKERDSIKRMLQELRSSLETEGSYATIGYGGTAHYYSANGHVSGIQEGGGHWKAILACGIPTVDVRPMVDAGNWTIRTPMIAVGKEPDPEPYHALSYAPRDVVFKEYKERGALIHNWN